MHDYECGIRVDFKSAGSQVFDFAAISISEEITEVRVDGTVAGWVIRTRDGMFMIMDRDGELYGTSGEFQSSVMRVVSAYRKN